MMNQGTRPHNARMLQWAIVIALAIFSCSREIQVEPLGVFGPSRLKHVLGQDGVASIRFDDSLTLWTFGDTMLGSWKGDVSAAATFSEKAVIRSMLPNSLAFTGPLSSRSIARLDFTYYTEKGKIVPFIQTGPGENPARTRLWALDGIRIGGTVFVYYLDIHVDDPGKPMAITLRGTGLARWDVPPRWKMGDGMVFKRTTHIFGGKEPAFGGSVIEKDGYIYTVGQFSTKDFKSFARIARAPVGDLEKRKAYRFLAPGGRWTGDISESLALFGDVSGECTLSYNAALGKYVIVYCKLWKNELAVVRFGDFRELDAPDVRTVYTLPPLPRKGEKQEHFYYSGKEVYAEGRDLYVIYINPADYQPYLVRIKL